MKTKDLIAYLKKVPEDADIAVCGIYDIDQEQFDEIQSIFYDPTREINIIFIDSTLQSASVS